MHHRFESDGKTSALWLSRFTDAYHLQIENGWSGPVALVQGQPEQAHLVIDGASEPVRYAIDGDTIYVHCRGRAYTLRFIDPLLAYAATGAAAGQNIARAPMPGTVVFVNVTAGDGVVAGTTLMVIESMKLETAIRASQDGVVAQVHVKPGDSFDRDAVLVTLSQDID